MTADLVPGGCDFADQRGEALRYPAEHEERRRHLAAIEQLQDAPRVRDDAAGVFIPSLPRHLPLERGDLEVIFDVNSERVQHLVTGMRVRLSRFAQQTESPRPAWAPPPGAALRRRGAFAARLRSGTPTKNSAVQQKIRKSNDAPRWLM